MKITEYKTYVKDENNNRCFYTYFGSKEKAIEALKSLVNCYNCYNCRDCSGLCNNKKILTEIPKIKDIHQKLFEAVNLPNNSLNMDTWHTCNATHCRSGWIVHLAGEKGYALERETDTAVAGMMIYKASSLIVPSFEDFHLPNKEALENIEECALYESVIGNDLKSIEDVAQ